MCGRRSPCALSGQETEEKPLGPGVADEDKDGQVLREPLAHMHLGDFLGPQGALCYKQHLRRHPAHSPRVCPSPGGTSGLNGFSCLAPSGRPAGEQRARPANPPILPAPQKAAADAGNGPVPRPQVLSVSRVGGCRRAQSQGHQNSAQGPSGSGRGPFLAVCVGCQPRSFWAGRTPPGGGRGTPWPFMLSCTAAGLQALGQVATAQADPALLGLAESQLGPRKRAGGPHLRPVRTRADTRRGARARGQGGPWRTGRWTQSAG